MPADPDPEKSGRAMQAMLKWANPEAAGAGLSG
jgi:hypothetical protein